ncbi:hypothetical protein ABDB91_18420 [Desulfoscipio sp. XC116]|uniref:hypothetical protein n=1 Tax=Desulfoscipio sp. XC116 TaxID=3144975 RepID=UPI00325BBB07
MSWHNLVNQIIRIEEQEIELYQRIAAGAPSQCLREMVCNRIEWEKESLNFWRNFLGYKDCSVSKVQEAEAKGDKK